MPTDKLTVAGLGVSDDQVVNEIGKHIGEAVLDYFRLRNECVPAYGDDFGTTKEDAIAALEHDLESIYMDWRRLCS